MSSLCFGLHAGSYTGTCVVLALDSADAACCLGLGPSCFLLLRISVNLALALSRLWFGWLLDFLPGCFVDPLVSLANLLLSASDQRKTCPVETGDSVPP